MEATGAPGAGAPPEIFICINVTHLTIWLCDGLHQERHKHWRASRNLH